MFEEMTWDELISFNKKYHNELVVSKKMLRKSVTSMLLKDEIRYCEEKLKAVNAEIDKRLLIRKPS